jgi:HAD superfamily hydrolase (TIGR01509 family)
MEHSLNPLDSPDLVRADIPAREALALPQAVLWDMDGTLVDTEPYWIVAEQELVEAHGGTWTHEQATRLFGVTLSEAASIFQAEGVDLPSEQIIDFLISRMVEQMRVEAPWRPGALALLAELGERGVPCALVTMSYRSLAEHVVDLAPSGAFQTLVCGDDVTHDKPHPEPYLLAAERLGVDVTRCVAIEDSPTGIASARAAGATTLGVGVGVGVGVPSAVPGLHRASSLDRVDAHVLSRLLAGDVIDLVAD